VSDLPAISQESAARLISFSENGDVAPADSALPGYRLQRLEILNWGTFDGAVHTMELDGQTTLLVGQNGAGKSTLVDALLTLLVRPGRSRNYNLAAGAKQTERSEKSYVLGAFDRRSQEDTNRGEVQYLRGRTTYSVLLACFRNCTTDRVFTLAQLLYLNDGGVERMYCFVDDDRSIARDLSGLQGMDRLAQEIKRRGFRATTKYSEYFEWFRKATGVKDQAMDMFNQTVAVKDIQRLNDFIRKHMLEAKPWSDKVDELFKHFKDLSDAHGELERVRQERDLLQPIEKHGADLRAQAEQYQQAQRLLAATDSYFPRKIVDLFEPELARSVGALTEVQDEQQRLQMEIAEGHEACRRLKNEIEQAGGERMREIPLLIDKQLALANAKRAEFGRLTAALRGAGVEEPIESAAAFAAMHAKLRTLRAQLQADVAAIEVQRTTLIEARVDPIHQLREAEAELQLLMSRQGNLPREYVEMRRQLCESLRLSERDLPFAAEMITVKPEQHVWQSSIEMALRGFGLSLLVPQRHYALVSRTIERTVLRDSRGHGQRLVYRHVGERERQVDGPLPGAQSLFWKIDFRDGWSPLLPWVKAEIQTQYDIRCCETIEELQQSPERAMTSNRHLKHTRSRHEKDDRPRVADPRHFVLGWDNREKKLRLSETIESLRRQMAQMDGRITQLEHSAQEARDHLRSAEDALQFKSFLEIDFDVHDRQVVELRLELKAMEENDGVIQLLKQQLAAREERGKALEQTHYQAVRREQQIESDITFGQRVVAEHQRVLAAAQANGVFEAHASCFPVIDQLLDADPVSLANFSHLPDAFRRARRNEVDQLRNELRPLEENVVKAMSRFLSASFAFSPPDCPALSSW